MAIDGISRDLIEDSKSGIFVEPENPYDFANKVHYYINNPQFLLEHGLNGYNYAKVNFDRDYLANSYITNIQNYLKIYSK
jgi:glycosyltransferase involved in cell wall biosynthesis